MTKVSSLIPHELALFDDETLFGTASINVGMAYFLLNIWTPVECSVAQLRGLHYCADQGGRIDSQRPVIAVMHPAVKTAVVIENNALIHTGAPDVRVPLYLLPVPCLSLLVVPPEVIQQYERPHAAGAEFHVSLEISSTGWHNVYWLQGYADQRALAAGLNALLCGVQRFTDETWGRLRPQVMGLRADDCLVIELTREGDPYTRSLLITHRDRMISRRVN